MNRSLLLLCASAWFLVVCWAAVIYHLSAMSGQEVQAAMPWDIWDKALHFAAFFAGGFLIAAAVRSASALSWGKIIPIAALTVSIYGATDEWHQTYTPGRHGGDPGDWAADTLGGIAGASGCALAAWQVARRRGRGLRASL